MFTVPQVIKGEEGDDFAPQTGWPGPPRAERSPEKSPVNQGEDVLQQSLLFILQLVVKLPPTPLSAKIFNNAEKVTNILKKCFQDELRVFVIFTKLRV